MGLMPAPRRERVAVVAGFVRARQDRLALAVVLLFLAMTTWLAAPPDVIFHVDTARDILIAREYALGIDHGSLGSISSALLHHGFVWQWSLSVWIRTGSSTLILLAAIGAVHIAAGLALYQAMRASSGMFSSLLGIVTYGLITSITRELFFPLWNPTLATSGFVVVIWLGWMASSKGRQSMLWTLLPALAFSVVSQVHVELLFFLPAMFLVPAFGRARWLAWLSPVPALLLSWWLLSRDSLMSNIGAIEQLFGGGRSAPSVDWTALPLGVPGWLALFAVAAYAYVSKRGQAKHPEFARFLAAALACYLLAYVVVAALHGGSERYVEPLLPPALLLLGLLGSEVVERHARRLAVAVAIAAVATMVFAMFGGPRFDHRIRLTLSEISALREAMQSLGYGLDEAYRFSSPAQAWQPEFASGIWLDAPCLFGTRRLGGSSRTREQVLMVAIPHGIPMSARVENEFQRTVRGDKRDFFLKQFEPYVRVTHPSVSRLSKQGGESRSPFDVSFENRGFQRSCWSRDWPHDAVSVAPSSSAAVAIEFPVIVPANAPARVIYLAPMRVGNRVDKRCRGRIERFIGVDGEISENGATGLLRGSTHEKTGVVRIVWPWEDSMCFPDGQRPAFPVPVAEIDEEMFEYLRPFLEHPE
jgi:hypothetical protein